MDTERLVEIYTEDWNRLRRAVRNQELVGGSGELADTLIDVGEIVGCAADSDLYTEGSVTRGIFFILQGTVGLYRSGNLLYQVAAKKQLGSWPLLFDDPAYDVGAKALTDTVCLLVSVEQFRKTADKFPGMWERLAWSQAVRLKESNEIFLPTNATPKLLIGSSKKQVETAGHLAEKIRTESQRRIDVKLWTDDNVFPEMKSYLESLTAGLDEWDFAVFLVTPDDEVVSREVRTPAPRDNIIFEAGLCVGRLGRKRTSLLVPEEPSDLKIPSDLAGISLLKYRESVDEQLGNILDKVDNLGPRTRVAVHKLDT